MKPFAIPAFVLFLLQCSLSTISGVTQEDRSVTRSPGITLHSSADLVLVDVMVLNAKNSLPEKTLQRDDFQVFDNGHPVSIKTFDSGSKFATRSLALWFVVQCYMKGWEAQGSGLFAGQISLFKPALKYMGKQDSVAVAHWCDNGDSIDELLETSAIAFGLRDRRSPRIWLLGEQGAVANYIATETGGQYLRVTPETYAAGLKEILQQVHGRYELGFKPAVLDGKRHKLRVQLTDAAKNQHRGGRLRYRAAYVPIDHEVK